MILPIRVYGDPVLRERTQPVTQNTPELQQLVDDMIETMHGATGVGLAAPQIGRNERVFVADLSNMADQEREEGRELPPQPMVFINPEILDESPEDCEYEEGCLSIPDLREPVFRPETVVVRYLDRDFNVQELHAEGMLARVIQHEYDHLEGILFLDRISVFRRRLLKRRLREIASGMVEADYPLFLNPSTAEQAG
jgi:peptide deformylase